MKKLANLYLLLVSMAFVFPAHAGTGHSHDKDGGHSNQAHSHGPIDSNEAKKRALSMLNGLVKKGVIDNSWQGIKPAKAEKKTFSKGPEWVVSFNNTKLRDKSKQTLYIFYSLDGHYIAANYTGK
ncbi:MAG: DUF6488 family protein [Gammaproteobacteria bacterium]|nr:DUF6488 family protein [Gammaproteobacteria bacterium]